MKILLVCDVFAPEFAPRMGYLCKYLKRKGCELDVVCEQYADDRRFAFLQDTPSKIKRLRFYRSLSMPKPKSEWGILMLRDLIFHYKDRRLVKETLKDSAFTNYDLVLCSTYRTFPLRAAACLAKHFRVPLVADLRDIMEQYPDKSYFSHRLPCAALFSRILLKTRNKVLKQAAAATTVSPWHTNLLKAINPNTRLIYNGYDPELFFPAPQADPFFRIVYTGRLISLENRNPEMLFAAIRRLLDSGRIDKADFRLCWYVDKDTNHYIKSSAEKYHIEDITECPGFIPADQIPACLNRASVLLQLAQPADEKGPKGIMTTKIFEALAVGKPLLLVPSDRSYLAKLIHDFDCGLAANEPAEIEEFIATQYRLWKQNGHTSVAVHPQVAELFSRERQAEQFLQLFKEVLKHD